ncbi:hypothetical protein HELRODRAFT_193156 [Helobdella robusta]|uniref:Aminopeptidase n=1 Tax=Helobdella robusta TaxID=6412 RepID=T1FUP0_HELRO|nr:hypothetical protein HELRODRAFT_193156 [Helobdella robusta]ESN97982.1 hypothetical protein HELRODRAFT_193156 [Helobdella robusta]
MAEIEEVSFSGTSKSDKNLLFNRGSLLNNSTMYTCSPRRAAFTVAAIICCLFAVSVIAAFARPACSMPPSPNHTSVDADHKLPSTNISQPTNTATTDKISNVKGSQFRWNKIRLPTTLVPHSYGVLIHPDMEKFDFSGWSSVEVVVKSSTDYIVMHVKQLNISDIGLRYRNRDDRIEMKKYLISVEREQLYIELTSNLIAGSTILINVSFHGVLSDNMNGFFLNFYITRGGVKRYLAATQFEPTEARSAFPCFDEPHMKAHFKFNIIRPKDYISLFNTEKVAEKMISENETMDIFNTTLKMSTYLVAFVVCDYLSKSQLSKSGVNISVYAPPEAINDVNVALDKATKILDFYEDFYGIKYPLKKLDNVAIPDMSVGAMENWGPVLYISKYLLLNESRNSEHDKNMVVVVVAHELAHQWFGNLVTMEWWNDLWLNEGFAKYIEYVGTNHIFPDWPMMEIFTCQTMAVAMVADSSDASHSISDPVYDPNEINEIFDSISYDKGASVIRMLENVVGPDVFYRALKNYLTKHQFDTANNNDLWESFTQQLKDTMHINVKEMMDTWTLQMGFPVVSMSRNGRQVTCRQERYVITDQSKLAGVQVEPSRFNYLWFIPLTFVTDRHPNNHSMYFMKEKTLRFELPEDVNWLKANSNMTGFYRVHYDDNGWSDIIRQLKSDHTHRPHEPDDGARPLVVPGEGGELQPLEDDDGEHQDDGLQDVMKKLMTPILKKLGWEDVGDHDTKLIRIELMSLATRLGFQEYVDWVMRSFKQMVNGSLRLSPNQQSIVFRYAVKYGGAEEWDFVMNSAMSSNTSQAQKAVMLDALTFSNDVLRVTRLLEMSLNQTLMKTNECLGTLTGVGKHSAGQLVLWNFIKKNWSLINDRIHGMPKRSRAIVRFASFLFSTEVEYDELQTFLNEHMSKETARLNIELLDAVRMNINWKAKSEDQLVQWLLKQTSH